MWSRFLLISAVIHFGCGTPPPPPPPPDPVIAPAPVPVPEPEPEPEPTPEPPPEPPAPPPPPEPEVTCEELDRSRCVVTQGCEWHTIKKCLTQDKPKTLDDSF